MQKSFWKWQKDYLRMVNIKILIIEDYNDFYIASKQESIQQLEIAKEIVENVELYLKKQELL